MSRKLLLLASRFERRLGSVQQSNIRDSDDLGVNQALLKCLPGVGTGCGLAANQQGVPERDGSWEARRGWRKYEKRPHQGGAFRYEAVPQDFLFRGRGGVLLSKLLRTDWKTGFLL
jgi:hypothetical protein